MAASRALRFPKPATIATSLSIGASAVESIGGLSYYKTTDTQFGAVLAPARYSQVRKVRVTCTIRNLSATPIVAPRMKVWVASVTGAVTNPDVQTITPGAAAASYFFVSSITAGRLFSKSGTIQPNIGDLTNGAGNGSVNSVLFEIEFDRFDGTSNDFFAMWDAVTGTNQYIQLRPAVAATSGPSNTLVDFFTCSAIVVQAPSPANNSITYTQVWRPFQTGQSGPGVFDSANGTAGLQTRGAWRWRYNAADWNGITSVHLMFIGNKRLTGTSFDVRFVRVTSSTQGAGSTTTLVSASPTFTANNQIGWWRSADLLAQLVDGGDYGFDFRNGFDGGGSAVGAGEATCYIEIVQTNYTKTAIYHHCNPSGVDALNGITSGTIPRVYPGAFLFDPLFYANFPNTRILKRRIIGQNNHRIAGLYNPSWELAINSNLTENQNAAGGGLTATTRIVTPVQSATPINTAAWKYRDDALVSNDPIELSGVRKCFLRLEGNWGTVTPDHPGSMALMYALDVPNTETLPLGDVFELGAFNPEGCASTAAGLGDPGILVITNGSVIPKKFNPAALTIEDAGIPEPVSYTHLTLPTILRV